MTGDVVTRIDAAVEGRCACGCGAVLDRDGPSAWFASEACQWRWQGAGRGQPPMLVVIDPEAARAALQRANEALTHLLGGLVPVFEAMGQQLAAVADQIRLMLSEQPPQMERALWARRNRNTGPKAQARAPRRIDPRRSR
jgi:hypothetical protein